MPRLFKAGIEGIVTLLNSMITLTALLQDPIGEMSTMLLLLKSVTCIPVMEDRLEIEVIALESAYRVFSEGKLVPVNTVTP